MGVVAIFWRDVGLAFKQNMAPATGFFLILLLSFVLSGEGGAMSGTPMSGTPSSVLPILWVGLLLAHLLLVGFFFDEDEGSGLLDLMLMEIKIPALIVVAKSLALWVGAGLPLAAQMAAVAFFSGLSFVPAFVAGALASLGFVFWLVVAAALTHGLRAPAWLVPIFVLPLTLPLLVFAAGAASAAASGENFFASQAFMLLLGVVLFVLGTAPLAAHFILRIKD